MRRAVCLASGGLDSSTCLYILKDSGFEITPLFIDYGQRNKDREKSSLLQVCEHLGISDPIAIDISSFGSIVRTGLTDETRDIVSDAFTPGRNLIFISFAAAVARQLGINNIVMGLLSEKTAIFPDQTDSFIDKAAEIASEALGDRMNIILPLRDFTKQQVVDLSLSLGVKTYYSCHAGGPDPCGKCISCLEYGEN